MSSQTDELIYYHVREQNKEMSLNAAFDQVASNVGYELTSGQVQSAYYRFKKVVEQSVLPEAPVEPSKPLRDGTEGDSITEITEIVEVLMEQAWQMYQSCGDVLAKLAAVEVKAAGTERMSKLADILKLDR